MNPAQFFELEQSSYDLRGHQYTLKVHRSRSEIQRNFFTQRVIRYWNKSPDELIKAKTEIELKRKLDKWNGVGY